MGRAGWPSQERRIDEPGYPEVAGESFLPVCRSKLRDSERVERPLVADVDFFRGSEHSGAVPVPMG